MRSTLFAIVTYLRFTLFAMGTNLRSTKLWPLTRSDFYEIYMPHDQQQNTDGVQKGGLYAYLERSILV